MDVSDIYAWTAADGRHLNLVMTMLGHTFSNKIQYVLHIDSGKDFGHTLASTTIECSFPSAANISCELGDADSASGNPTNRAGLPGRNNLFRVYAGPMDDPFYNNIKGLGAAYQTALTAIKDGAAVDAAGCAQATTKAIRDRMTHTDGGAAQNFLGNWTVSAIVFSVLQVGPSSAASSSQIMKPVGLPLEIVPEANPYSVPHRSTLPIRVVYQGHPLAGALVKLTDLTNDASPFEVHLTNGDGRATFTMPGSGSWLLNVIWTTAQPASDEVDFETVFSSLSFGFPADVAEVTDTIVQ